MVGRHFLRTHTSPILEGERVGLVQVGSANEDRRGDLEFTKDRPRRGEVILVSIIKRNHECILRNDSSFVSILKHLS